MISPYTALTNQLNTASAAGAPLVTASKMHSVANDYRETSEHSDMLTFAMVAAQNIENSTHKGTTQAASSTDVTSAALTTAVTPATQSGTTTLASATLPLSSTDKAVATAAMMNGLSNKDGAASSTSSHHKQTTQQLQHPPAQSFLPQPLQHGSTTATSSIAAATSIPVNGLQNTVPPSAFAALTNEVLAADGVEPSLHAVTSTAKTQANIAQWGPVSVSQSAPMMMQAQEMLSPLREQLRFQIDQQIKQAELRLDPPELGKVELNIRFDDDRLHIQMHAANPAVRDALLMGLDRLRNELAMDHGGQIDVDINQQGEQKQDNQQSSSGTIAAASLSNTDSSIDNLSPQDDVDLLA